jgi:hypothetical protein
MLFVHLMQALGAAEIRQPRRSAGGGAARAATAADSCRCQ